MSSKYIMTQEKHASTLDGNSQVIDNLAGIKH
jgi:hypothetical protein